MTEVIKTQERKTEKSNGFRRGIQSPPGNFIGEESGLSIPYLILQSPVRDSHWPNPPGSQRVEVLTD